MEDYAGRVLADRYRLPLPPSDEYELTETRAFDTYSGQEVLVRQVPLPEVVEAEVLDAEGLPDGFTARDPRGSRRSPGRGVTRRPTEPAVRRAVDAAQAAARIPDHPRLDQVFDVFAEGGSLWIVSESVAARPLAALLAEKPLTPYRAAEVASDVLMALRVLHAHGWVHRNITARTVLVCDDGRVMLTGLAVGAAEEALCGYDPVPVEAGEWGSGDEEFGAGHQDAGPQDAGPQAAGSRNAGPQDAGTGGHGVPDGYRVPGQAVGEGSVGGHTALGGAGGSGAAFGIGAVTQGVGPGPVGASGFGGNDPDPEAARRAAIEARESRGLPSAGVESVNDGGSTGALVRREPDGGTDIRAARAGAIAAYRAGARAAARVQEAQNSRAALPGARPAPDTDFSPTRGTPQELTYPAAGGPGQAYPATGGPGQSPYPTGSGVGQPAQDAGSGVEHVPGSVAPGQTADPYGVRPASWHGAVPRGGVGGTMGGGAPGAVEGQAPGLGAVPTGGPVPGGVVGAGGPRAGSGTDVGDMGVGGAGAGGGVGAAPARWEELAHAAPAARRGPATALAAERARQARMAVVGPVTERWAPEQAGPVHENWQLAAPIGPATDLWALGALLFRAVQGHAPYPEESTAELVQLVCAEPPAFAEECGPLRPVVESLLRQDPTERLDFEELRGWLRSLVRSAPEPEAGVHVVAAPPVDKSRLPIVRRRGELVRRRRAGLPATSAHGRHKRAREQAGASPRRLGRNLLLLILLVMAAAIAYAMYFMPKAGPDDQGAEKTGSTSQAGPAQPSDASSEPSSERTTPAPTTPEPSRSSGAAETQTAGPEVADGFTVRTDPEGFKVAVANGWNRTPRNGRGQVVYSQGNFELIVVPGRDTAAANGDDPMVYQREKEPELQPYRDSSWATATGLKSIQVGTRSMAEGQFTWTGDDGRELYVRNLAMLVGGKYHVVQVRGPEAERDEVTRLYEQASATYQVTG
ncbi:protein kinase [Streptomyces sp. 351MFTsu5.1]|uniref:protein kinase n=1 Tax=Streptomyces sp. 351MFTsu5.1 TaxID=1172180 RepID=UPI00039DF800|nr:protein kinase [Streptomyces sp. 351MFTsu5.1]